MKILHLIFTDRISGAEKYLLDLLPELKNYGFECELMCVGFRSDLIVLEDYCQQMLDRNIPVTLLTTKSRLGYLKTAKAVNRHLKKNNIRIIHSHLFNGDFIAVLIKAVYNKALIILSTKHGYQEKYLVKYWQGNHKIPYDIYYLISRFMFKRIDHNLSISSAISNMYSTLKLVKSKLKYIHHGINVKPEFDESAYIKGDPKIMIVGRLVKMKGHKYLIDALPAVIKKFPHLKLLILGEGYLKNELIEQADASGVSSYISFLGFKKPGIYSPQCQVMVLPSLFEPFGLVFIESFALQIPVIAFNAPAANEIITDNETGFLVNKNDSKALAEKIIYVLQNPEERKRVVNNAYERFLNYFNVKRMASETADWYKSLNL